MTVMIGTGNATTMQRAATAKQVMDVQERIIQGGGLGLIVTPEHVYNAASDFVSAIGKRSAERYFQDPTKVEQQPKKQEENPLVQAEKVKAEAKLQGDQLRESTKAQLAQMKQQFDAQMNQLESQHKQQIELLKMRTEYENASRDRESREAIAIMQSEVKAMIEGLKVDIGQPGIGAEFNEVR
jgi:hypothetical protein